MAVSGTPFGSYNAGHLGALNSASSNNKTRVTTMLNELYEAITEKMPDADHVIKERRDVIRAEIDYINGLLTGC